MPSTVNLVQEIRDFVETGQQYRALKSAKQLIAREQEIMHDVASEGLSKNP